MARAEQALPSGRQLEIVHGDQRLVVVEVGGGIRIYEVAGAAVLDGYDEPDMCTAARGQVLAPWPNRIDAGRYVWRGRAHQLPLTEPARGNAIHGLVRWSRWDIDRASEARAVARTAIRPQPGYPFSIDLMVAYELGDTGVHVATAATNVGTQTAPFGLGFHPYVAVATAIDDARVTVPAHTVLLADDRGIPTARAPVARGDDVALDGRPLGSRAFDHCFTGLERDAAGIARVIVESDGRRVTVWMDEGFDHVMVFTGDTLSGDERRRSIAIEPMSCAPNALATDDVDALEPGRSRTFRWGIEPS